MSDQNNSSMFIKIMEKLSDLSVGLGRVETRCESMETRLTSIEKHDEVQNNLLDEHILNSSTNTQRLTIEVEARKEAEQKREALDKELLERIEKLERVPKFLGSLKAVAIYVTTIIGALLMITKLMDLW